MNINDSFPMMKKSAICKVAIFGDDILMRHIFIIYSQKTIVQIASGGHSWSFTVAQRLIVKTQVSKHISS